MLQSLPGVSTSFSGNHHQHHGVFEGNLKQQCLDPTSGLYEWVSKYFRLQVETGLLESCDIAPSTQVGHGGTPTLVQAGPTQTTSLQAAKYAKEWAVSAALVGCGFDVVWTSGKIWSFLADNESGCQMWVRCINDSINSTKRGVPGTSAIPSPTAAALALLARPPLHPETYAPSSSSSFAPANHFGTQMKSHFHPTETGYHYSHNNTHQIYNNGIGGSPATHASGTTDNEQSTQLDNPLSPFLVSHAKRPPSPTLSSSFQPSSIPHHHTSSQPQNASPHLSSSHPKDVANISEIPLADSVASRSGDNSTVSSPESSEGSSEAKVDLTQDRLQPFSERLKASSSSSSAASSPSPSSSGLPPPPPHSTPDPSSREKPRHTHHHHSSSATQEQIVQLRLQCNDLATRLEREISEGNLARELCQRLQSELDSRTQSYEQQIQSLFERERVTISEIRSETQSKLNAVTADNDSLHQAAARLAKEQFQRQLDLAKEELEEERRRFAQALRKETERRDTAESKEMNLKQEILSLKDSLARLTTEHTRLREISRSEAGSWDRERTHLVSEWEGRIAKLEEEKASLLSKHQHDLKSKTLELTQRFDRTLKEMEVNINETCRHQLEAEKLREITAIQKKCTKDIEKARTDERRAGLAEVERVKLAYTDRERATLEDLTKLEKVHSDRVKGLERQIAQYKDKEAKQEKTIQDLTLEIKKSEAASKNLSQNHRAAVEEYAIRVASLEAHNSQLTTALQEAKASEMTLRERLTKTIEEARLQRAELIEAKRQASNGSAQVHSWKAAVKESDITAATTATALQIAQDEVAMLEHELKRVKADHAALVKLVHKNEKLVYGVVTPATAAVTSTYIGVGGNHDRMGGVASAMYAQDAGRGRATVRSTSATPTRSRSQSLLRSKTTHTPVPSSSSHSSSSSAAGTPKHRHTPSSHRPPRPMSAPSPSPSPSLSSPTRTRPQVYVASLRGPPSPPLSPRSHALLGKGRAAKGSEAGKLNPNTRYTFGRSTF